MPMTVDIVLPHDLAMKIFGMYLFNTQEKADLSEFREGGIFFDEIERSLRGLTAEDQRAALARFEAALN